jgi:hypothetical protein
MMVCATLPPTPYNFEFKNKHNYDHYNKPTKPLCKFDKPHFIQNFEK